MVNGNDKLKNIEKLSPEERIKKLKEIEEKNKEEIEKAHELIKESEDEIDKDEIEEKIKQVEMPPDEEIDVAKLFRPKGGNLEETVARERPKISEEEIKQQQEYLRGLQTPQIEQRAEYIQQRVQQTGYISNEQRNEISNMYQEVRQREDGIREGTYKAASRNIEEQLSVAKKILSDMYQR